MLVQVREDGGLNYNCGDADGKKKCFRYILGGRFM